MKGHPVKHQPVTNRPTHRSQAHIPRSLVLHPSHPPHPHPPQKPQLQTNPAATHADDAPPHHLCKGVGRSQADRTADTALGQPTR